MSGKKVREDVAENQQVNRDEEVKATGQVRTDEVVGLLVHKQLNITLLLKNLLININTIKNLKDTDGGINIGTSLSFSIWIISCQLRIQNFSVFLSWVF